MTIEVVCASANPDKVAEIAAILAAAGVTLLPRPAEVGEVDETENTLVGNARLKAQALAAATGRPAVADDTGLDIDALGGEPGVHAARYSGEGATYASNVAKVLRRLAEEGATAPAARRARFRAVAMVVWPDGRELWREGVLEGSIATEARGGNGFGYDPVFVVAGDAGGRTLAELSAEEKHAISHRGLAFRALAEALAAGAAPPAEPS
jgi:XTP/dITP diphosphohydrolase